MRYWMSSEMNWFESLGVLLWGQIKSVFSNLIICHIFMCFFWYENLPVLVCLILVYTFSNSWDIGLIIDYKECRSLKNDIIDWYPCLLYDNSKKSVSLSF